MNRFARISVNIAQVSGVFDYSIPAELAPIIQIGSLVQVPFGKQIVQGIVVALPAEAMVAETRPVEAVIESEPVVTPHQIALAEATGKTKLFHHLGFPGPDGAARSQPARRCTNPSSHRTGYQNARPAPGKDSQLAQETR